MSFLTTTFGFIGYAVISIILIAIGIVCFGTMAGFMCAMICEAWGRGKPNEWQGFGTCCGIVGAPIWIIYCFTTGGIASAVVDSIGLFIFMLCTTFAAWLVYDRKLKKARAAGRN